MSIDPFERFESSRGGLLIPVGLFIIGSIATTIAVAALHRIEIPVVTEPKKNRPVVEAAEEATPALTSDVIAPSRPIPQETAEPTPQ
ncbi:hypothetical protein Poly59_51200 [Rubripirellula reticaptiva]|uniref:Uncharacterized protein n=2 Tax=Rubripirellula reticaptiva TaxID=2528013 RepID=A0A5C6EIE6_9BACT|nr:hypothetical protein Poly59_51200 [Rubripirellula reticaptiva]